MREGTHIFGKQVENMRISLHNKEGTQFVKINLRQCGKLMENKVLPWAGGGQLLIRKMSILKQGI